MLSRVSRSRSRLASRALWTEKPIAVDPFCAAARKVIAVAASGRVDLERFRWRPEDEFAGKKKGPTGPAPFI
jgi:hypothetical protein